MLDLNEDVNPIHYKRKKQENHSCVYFTVYFLLTCTDLITNVVE